MTVRILTGDCRSVLATLPDESVHCCVTSPPYFNLRDYQIAGQIGLEPTPDTFVAELVAVFREVKRVLRKDGTVWLNLGDSYASGEVGRHDALGAVSGNAGITYKGLGEAQNGQRKQAKLSTGLPSKNLIGIPWRVAFALQADGWFLRQDIIWSKPNPMPESVRDRCTKAHEYLFLLSKSASYYYDAEAIQEPLSEVSLSQIATYQRRGERSEPLGSLDKSRNDVGGRLDAKGRGARGAAMAGLSGRNRRSVWEVATQAFAEAHFATFPPALIEPCILAGCPERACAQCGAPWVREVERESVALRPNSDSIRGHSPSHVRAGTPQRGAMAVNTKTLGFSPSCSCGSWICPVDPDNKIRCDEPCDCCGGGLIFRPSDTVAGTVLDPFGGAGTTGLVADRLKRNAVLIELNPEYAHMAQRRISDDAPMFSAVTLSPPPATNRGERAV